MEYNSDFRYDLKIGQEYETLLSEVIESTIEVKRDFKCYETGNLFVEYESRGKKSGISTTQAKWWVYWFSKTRCILIETSELKQLCRKYLGTSRDVLGGDSNTSKGILLPTKDFLDKSINY